MYIAPNSTIKLLTGVPIDKNQSDTLWFESKAAQTAYFNGKVKRTFSALSEIAARILPFGSLCGSDL